MSELHILWRDAHLVAVYKPAGWLVHRTGLDAGETRFVMQTLRDQLGQRVYPVHRLDKGTCGVLVMALHCRTAPKSTTRCSPTTRRPMRQRKRRTRAFAAWRGWNCPRHTTRTIRARARRWSRRFPAPGGATRSAGI